MVDFLGYKITKVDRQNQIVGSHQNAVAVAEISNQRFQCCYAACMYGWWVLGKHPPQQSKDYAIWISMTVFQNKYEYIKISTIHAFNKYTIFPWESVMGFRKNIKLGSNWLPICSVVQRWPWQALPPPHLLHLDVAFHERPAPSKKVEMLFWCGQGDDNARNPCQLTHN